MYFASSTALTSEDVYSSRIKRKLSNNAVKLDNCKNSIIGFHKTCICIRITKLWKLIGGRQVISQWPQLFSQLHKYFTDSRDSNQSFFISNVKTALPRRWRSGPERSPRKRKVGCSNPSRDRPESLKKVVTALLLKAIIVRCN